MNEWKPVKLLNGWTTYEFDKFSYKVKTNGAIIFRGQLAPGDKNKACGKLPFEMEPDKITTLFSTVDGDIVGEYSVDEQGYLFFKEIRMA